MYFTQHFCRIQSILFAHSRSILSYLIRFIDKIIKKVNTRSYRLMKLGQEVLNKISDLLVEIDKPKSPKRRPKKVNTQSVNEFAIMPDDRLYRNYQLMRDKAHQRQKNKIKQQMQRMQPFKVDNKHSIFLNSRKNLKPIHQRTPQILRDKDLSIEKKRTQVNRQRQMRKRLQQPDEDELAYEVSRSKSQKKIATKEELDQILKRLTQRERERMEKNNRQKMDYLKEKLMNNRQKPALNKNSQKIWQKMRVQNELSQNVFQRFDKYHWDQKKKQQQYIQKITQKQTPFKPQISKNSIQILNKSSTSRISLIKDLDRTRSCKCFSKQNQSQKSTNYLNVSARQPHHHNHSPSPLHSRSQVVLSPNK